MTMLNRRNFLRTLAGAAVAAPALAVSGRAEAQEAYIVGVAADGWDVNAWQRDDLIITACSGCEADSCAGCPFFPGHINTGQEIVSLPATEAPISDLTEALYSLDEAFQAAANAFQSGFDALVDRHGMEAVSLSIKSMVIGG